MISSKDRGRQWIQLTITVVRSTDFLESNCELILVALQIAGSDPSPLWQPMPVDHNLAHVIHRFNIL